MTILFFGDVVGRPGRRAVQAVLSDWRKKYSVDLVIANGENAAHGRGITKKSLQELLEAGVDVVTLGDHTWDQKGVVSLLEDKDVPLIRPANFPSQNPGRGFLTTTVRTSRVLIINLLGRVFMKNQYDDPFRVVDNILDEEEGDIIIVDHHAQATAEKVCLGWHLDGRVSAVLGTHTHIPTADERLLPGGTAYITDVGMVGVQDSSLGLDKEAARRRFLTQRNGSLDVPKQGAVEINAALMEFGREGQARKIQRLRTVQESKD